ncbi:MAG: lysozyme [Anderseniella sp.]
MSMRTSQAGIDLIKNYETLRLDAQDVEKQGKLTIGYGHYDDPNVVPGMIITEAQAEAFLREDLRKHEKQVMRAVKVPLMQNQFDALVSFSFNTGASSRDSVYEEINKDNQFKPGRGDLLAKTLGGPRNEQSDPETSFAGVDELDIHQMAEDEFSSLTLDDWAVIPDEDDPFGGRDPFADGVKWVPGLGPPPATP